MNLDADNNTHCKTVKENILNNELINLSKINKEIDISIKSISPFNKNIISKLFYSNLKEVQYYIEKICNSHNSEILISYGANHCVTKTIANAIIDQISESRLEKHPDYPYKFLTIEFNGLIHSTEEYIFGQIVKLLQINKDDFDSNNISNTNDNNFNNFANYQKVLEEYNEQLNLLINEKCYNTKENKKNKKNIKLIDYDNNKKTIIFNGPNETIYKHKYLVIYFHNLDQLFVKKKQTLFYTLLEIILKSKNIIFIGMAYSFNLIDSMEKRVRSRFIHTLIYPSISTVKDIYNTLSNSILHIAEKEEDNDEDIDIDRNNHQFVNKMDIEINENIDENNLKADCRNNNEIFSLNNSMKMFRMILYDNIDFMALLSKQFKLGYSITEILNTIKFYLSNILLELRRKERFVFEAGYCLKRINTKNNNSLDFNEKYVELEGMAIINKNNSENELIYESSKFNNKCLNNDTIFELYNNYEVISKFNKIKEIVNYVINNLIKIEKNGPEYYLLKDFPKIHIIGLICLYQCKKHYRDKIVLDNVYNFYLTFVKEKELKFKIDKLQFKKRLEELYNSNLISIKSDDKHNEIYDLKNDLDETKKMLEKLNNDKSINNFDTEMHSFLLS